MVFRLGPIFFYWHLNNKKYITSSNSVQHKAGSKDEMRWSPYIKSKWMERVPADLPDAHHRDGWNEMKRNDWNECGEMVELNLWQGKTGVTPRKTYPDSVSYTTKLTWSDRRELWTPAVGGELLTTYVTEPPSNYKYLRYKFNIKVIDFIYKKQR